METKTVIVGHLSSVGRERWELSMELYEQFEKLWHKYGMPVVVNLDTGAVESCPKEQLTERYGIEPQQSYLTMDDEILYVVRGNEVYLYDDTGP